MILKLREFTKTDFIPAKILFTSLHVYTHKPGSPTSGKVLTRLGDEYAWRIVNILCARLCPWFDATPESQPVQNHAELGKTEPEQENCQADGGSLNPARQETNQHGKLFTPAGELSIVLLHNRQEILEVVFCFR